MAEKIGSNPKSVKTKDDKAETLEKVKARAMQDVKAEIADEDVRDASIIAQYQRMTHYGISGYGTACAFANRLGLEEDAGVLEACLDNTRDGDEHMTAIASGEVNPAAAEA